jgi:ATPase subunit of ABC transporter with duplicated ATPase domains
VIILDEPTNHLDMESIESLNQSLGLFDGTTIFVSHDREFISSLATRLIEIKSDRFIEYSSYEDYQASQVN